MSKVIGNYELGTPLGFGTFSKVRIGTHKETGAKYAIKIMDKELVREEKAEEQIRREISLVKNLNHPNIVRLFEVLQTPTHTYLVLELVSGGELLTKIQDTGKLDENTARKYFQELVLGLRYCHAQRIAHRDLKPENLLIDPATGMIKISDFGLANMQPQQQKEGAAPATLMQTVCGTPNYVAPEVLREQGYDGMQADIWSCGVILFYMLSGLLPFEDENMSVLFNKIERGDYTMPRHFSADVKNLISQMLTVDPKKRITIDDIVRNPWFNVNFDPKLLTLGNLAPPPASAAANAITKIAPSKKEGAATPDDAISLLFRLLSINFLDLSATALGRMTHDRRRRFATYAGPIDAARKGVIGALESIRCNPKNPSPQEIKGFSNQPKGLLTYQINLYPTISAKVTLIVMKLGRGDENDFANFFAQISQQMGPQLSSTITAIPPRK